MKKFKNNQTITIPKPIGLFLANHNADTGYQNWNIERWEKEINDAKKMGANTIWYLPFQFGQHIQTEFGGDAPYWQLQIEISRRIKNAGLAVGIYQGLNDIFEVTIKQHQDWRAGSGKYFLEEAHACPSQTKAWQEIMSLREVYFKELPYIDYIITPATDYGGCSCDTYAPWPETYLQFFEKQVELCKKYHPTVKVVAAGHGITADDEDILRELIKTADWIDYVADIPRGAGKPIIKYYMAPEITMLDGWGKWGPCPIIETIEDCYKNDKKNIGGWVPYSEGIHDDVNRFACFEFAKNPATTALAVAKKYCRDWIGVDESSVPELAQVIIELGNSVVRTSAYVHPDRGIDGTEADKRVEVFLLIRANNPEVKNNYRYWLLFYRTLCEAMNTINGTLPLKTLEKELFLCREAFKTLEPEYSQVIESQHPGGRPGDTIWVCPRSFQHYWRKERSLDD